MASVVDAWLRLPADRRRTAIEAMSTVLEQRFAGDPVDRVIAACQAVLSAVDDDEAVEAFVRFVHVSTVSDGFGFDLLGYLGDDGACTDP